MMTEDKAMTLYQLLNEVKKTLQQSHSHPRWIVAEISDMKVNYSGHCYLELVEKEPEGKEIRAKARGTIWSSAFRVLKPYFETTARTKLEAGLKIMILATVEFHELYGLSLNISDIEPSYTLGDLTRQKQEIIDRLLAEGIFDMNRQLPLPDLPKSIAVISSGTAAGYGDFLDQLTGNAYGYRFHVRLFQAVMQGEEAENSITAALERIFSHVNLFDVVVIIRGGGARSDLHCFNSYRLSSHICQFPLPVLTGIGHERDESIADMVAHTRLKTPTAVAEFIIARFRAADEIISTLAESLRANVQAILEDEKARLSHLAAVCKPLVSASLSAAGASTASLNARIAFASRTLLMKHSTMAEKYRAQLATSVKHFLLEKEHLHRMLRSRLKPVCRIYTDGLLHHFHMLEEKTNYLDPFRILERGYSITYLNGMAVKDPRQVKTGDELESRLHGGKLKSKVINNNT